MGVGRFRDLSSISANIKLSNPVAYCTSHDGWQRLSSEGCTFEWQMSYGVLSSLKLVLQFVCKSASSFVNKSMCLGVNSGLPGNWAFLFLPRSRQGVAVLLAYPHRENIAVCTTILKFLANNIIPRSSEKPVIQTLIGCSWNLLYGTCSNCYALLLCRSHSLFLPGDWKRDPVSILYISIFLIGCNFSWMRSWLSDQLVFSKLYTPGTDSIFCILNIKSFLFLC